MLIDKDYKVLSVQNLRKYFRVGTGSKRIIVPAVDDISFDIYKGEVFGLVGESGCGKTTTGRTIIRLYNATDGIVEFTTGEGDKKETIIIGAGHETNRQNIRKARWDYKFNKIEFKPYLREKHELKNNYFKNRQALENSIKEAKENKKEFNKKTYKEYKDFKEQLFQMKYRHTLKKEDIAFFGLSELLKHKQKTDENLFRVIKYRLKFLKANYKSKKLGLKESAAITKEQQNIEIKELKANYIANKEELKKMLLAEKSNKDKIVVDKKEASAEKKKIKKQTRADIKNLKKDYKKELYKNHLDFYNQMSKKKTSNGYLARFLNKFSRIRLFFSQTKNRAKYNKVYFGRKGKLVSLRFKYYFNLIGLWFKIIFRPKEYASEKEKLAQLKENFKNYIVKEKKEIARLKEINKYKNVEDTLHKIQMIFQDPIESLNPRMTVREIVSEGLIVRGVKDKKYIEKKVREQLDLVGLSQDYLYRYPHEFSGGQRQRIGVARALICEPELIIADEPVSALDVSIQAQVINLLNELKEKLGLTILFIAHDLSVVKYFCDRIAVMYYGKIVEMASSDELFAHPLHPYTKALLSAVPQPDPIFEKQRVRTNYDPRMHNYHESRPETVEIKPNHFIYANSEEVKKYTEELKG